MTPTRSQPGQRRDGWSKAQRIMFLRAASLAQWNDQQRYIAMRHVGCPLDSKTKRPSVKHPRNSNGHFEQVMAIAESAAAYTRGAAGMADFPRPRERRNWKSAAEVGRTRLVQLARSIIAEASTRVPDRFDAGLERYIVEHTTADDAGEFALVRPRALDEVDGGQAHRCVEALRAYVGREFARRGLSPRNFTIPPAALKRASSSPPHALSLPSEDPPTAA